jgi:hypothetical protein
MANPPGVRTHDGRRCTTIQELLLVLARASQLAHSNLSHPLFRNPDRIPDCPKRRARFPCPRYRPVTIDSARNLLLHSSDHCALDACALFRACGSPGTRLFLLAYVRGIPKRRPTQAMRLGSFRASPRSSLPKIPQIPGSATVHPAPASRNSPISAASFSRAPSSELRCWRRGSGRPSPQETFRCACS